MYHTFSTILIPAIITFAATVIGIAFLVSYMTDSGVTAIDHNKRSRPTLPSSGGVAVAFGFAIGILAYAFGGSFSLYAPRASLTYLFATVIAVSLISFVGFLDDINVKAKAVKTTGMMDTRKGLKQWQKPLLSFIGAIPLMAVNAGTSVIRIPFIGIVDFGIAYPLVIIPLAVVFAANAFNLLGGFDGISTGTGVIASLGLLLYSVYFGTYTGAIISGILLAAMLAILLFNRYPSKIIPGDSFTYAAGTALVSAMILGNMESFGVIVFLPWIIEFLLHLRGRFDVSDLGKLQRDATFSPPYGKRIFSWTHVIMNLKPMKEWEVAACMWAIEAGFVVLAFAMKHFMLL